MRDPSSNPWAACLFGRTVRLRPLLESDFEELFAAAGDPLIWSLHPDRERYTRERFEIFFRSALASRGALVVIDLGSGQMIGSSRYTDHDLKSSAVVIGFTFLIRSHWGGRVNLELKTLMLNHAFQFVNTAYFMVGENNLRSRRAMTKVGGTEVCETNAASFTGDLRGKVLFQIRKADWFEQNSEVAFLQPTLVTPRLTLEPIDESHGCALWELFRDPRLHDFVPYEPLSLEKQRERCAKWASRRSPDGSELWLNWAGRERTSGRIVAHFQAGVDRDGGASVGYLVSRNVQRRGIATEGLENVFTYLRTSLGVRGVKAWIDTRNEASCQLAKRMGMTQIELVKDADTFKGFTSDEFVFSREF